MGDGLSVAVEVGVVLLPRGVAVAVGWEFFSARDDVAKSGPGVKVDANRIAGQQQTKAA